MLLTLILAAWPLPDATLQQVSVPDAGPKKVRLFLDAGHGAPGNEGNHGCHCQAEQDHTRIVSAVLARALEATGRFEVKQSRTFDHPRYQARIAAARAWKADVIVSLHSDARGDAFGVPGPDGGDGFQNERAPGFAVLWNDEGPAYPKREALGRALGSRLREAGFLAYDGADYGGLYRQDPVEPSGWIDTRPLKQRVYFLRASTIPTVIIETHHALDPREVARWDEPGTHAAFAAAVAAGVLDFMK